MSTGTSSAERLKQHYTASTGRPWDDEAGILWLSEHRNDLDDFLYTKTPTLEKLASLTLSDKANWLAQRFCGVCRADSVISTFPVRLPPESFQSLDALNRGAFKRAVARWFANREVHLQTGRVCLTLVFVCATRRNIRDLDNLAKLMMDALENVVMGNDRNVEHLNLLRVVHDDEEEYVLIHISESNLNDHSDVVYPRLRHSWAVGDALDLRDFLDGAE